jgi:hypothetical protein
MKVLFYIIMVAALILVTFFGLGPVVFADGSISERIITLLVVLMLYLLLGGIIIWFRKYYKSTQR